YVFFFFSSRRRHTRFSRDWSSDVCSSDLIQTMSSQLVNTNRPSQRISSPTAVAREPRMFKSCASVSGLSPTAPAFLGNRQKYPCPLLRNHICRQAFRQLPERPGTDVL